MTEKLNNYIDWFQNLSFFQYNSFVPDNISKILQLNEYIIYRFSFLNNIDFNIIDNFKYIDKNTSIILVENFIKKHKLNINIKKLIEKKVLIFEKKDINSKYIIDGESYYDEDNNRKIKIYLDNTIYDSKTIIHEIMHYKNQPTNGKRNYISDLLTEAVSYSIDMIFTYDISNDYLDDYKKYLFINAATIYNHELDINSIYRIINLYKKTNKIDKESYIKLYCEDNYEKELNVFDEFANNKRKIFEESWFTVSFPLAIYMFYEYIKDNKFISNIIKFSDELNNKNIIELLNIINIKDMDNDLFNKIKLSCDNFIKEIEGWLNEKK